MHEYLQQTANSPGRIAAQTGEIHSRLLEESVHLDAANFSAIHPHDLRILYLLYDEKFFGGRLESQFGRAIRFHLSRRMTRSAGITRSFRPPGGPRRYEIQISTTLLFQSFHDLDRPIVVCGLRCRDRLEALLRVFEHELVHLVEMECWTESPCSRPRFQSIAGRLFGHTQFTHALISQAERASKRFGVRVGQPVEFDFDGRRHVGRVNRITRRATILVEDAHGEPYSDGKRYLKYYIPLAMLRPLN